MPTYSCEASSLKAVQHFTTLLLVNYISQSSCLDVPKFKLEQDTVLNLIENVDPPPPLYYKENRT